MSIYEILLRSRRADGFTLFEVALSLALVAFGMVSMLILYPAGLRAQQLARTKIFASAKALEMVDAYNSFHNANPAIDIEAPNLWDVHSTYKSQAPDLESRVSSYRNGIFPLPLDIAQRLDSDGDEIQQLLAQGGYLYYSQPLATTGLKESAFGSKILPNEAQRLIIGIVGYPQNNAIQTFPPKAWPYYVAYPSPPLHIQHHADDVPPLALKWDARGCYLWEDIDQDDRDMRSVFLAYRNYDEAPDAVRAVAYAQAAADYCLAKGLPTALYDGTVKVGTFAPTPSGDRLHFQVSGLRFMAHAANCALKWGPTSAGAVAITADSVNTLHDNCLTLAMQFQANHPYDWGCPRPLQRAIMMDFPLIEFDLGSPPLAGFIFGNGSAARQWRPVPAQTISNLGRSSSHPVPGRLATYSPGTRSDRGNLWGDARHTTLTARFAAAERCRQIVFWAVDWQAYEDFERAPSAPVDASKYPKGAPLGGNDFAWCMNTPGFMDWQQYSYRNPEKVIVFTDASRTATGGNDSDGRTFDKGAPGAAVFSGRFGADRNFNGMLDRGSVPASVRMRAQNVARFNYYDLRVPAVIR